MTETITIRRPDDWHVHLRDGAPGTLPSHQPYSSTLRARTSACIAAALGASVPSPKL